MAACLQKALDQAGLTSNDLDYVNAHGTATVLNDALETQALVSLFEKPAPRFVHQGGHGPLVRRHRRCRNRVQSFGHARGDVASHVEHGKPQTDRLDFVPNHARSATLEKVASLSFGFGVLAAVVLGKPR